jgi:hypothetical protein
MRSWRRIFAAVDDAGGDAVGHGELSRGAS